MITKEINLKIAIKTHLNNEIISKIYYVDQSISQVKIVNQKKIKLLFEDKILLKKFNKIKINISKLITKLSLKPVEPKKNILHIKNIHLRCQIVNILVFSRSIFLKFFRTW